MGTSGSEVSRLPRLGVIMPCLNEAEHIRVSISSVLAFDYAGDLTLTVVDGMSDDGTRDILAELAAREPRLKLLDNPDRLHGPALNLAIDALDCEIVLRVDAHSRYPRDYAQRSVVALIETGAANVGGLWETVPGAKTPEARAIAFATSHRFGVGNADYRVGTTERRWTDTVPFGCWRLDTLRDVGGFATDIPYGEDDELNGRLIGRGGKVLLDPMIRVEYFARSSLSAFMTQFYRYGRAKPLSWRRLGRVPTGRQLAPLIFVMGIVLPVLAAPLLPVLLWLSVAALGTHLVVGAAVAFGAAREIGAATAFWLPPTFLLGHLAYGAGTLAGILRLLREQFFKPHEGFA